MFLPARAQMDVCWVQAFPTEVTCIDILPDGKWMLLSSWGTAFVYRMPDRQLAVALRGSRGFREQSSARHWHGTGSGMARRSLVPRCLAHERESASSGFARWQMAPRRRRRTAWLRGGATLADGAAANPPRPAPERRPCRPHRRWQIPPPAGGRRCTPGRPLLVRRGWSPRGAMPLRVYPCASRTMVSTSR